MGESVEALLKILRKDEYESAENSERVLSESTTELYEGFRHDSEIKSFGNKLLKYECALAKEVICECVSDLYLSSLVIDDVDKYADCLKSSMHEQCMSIMESAETIDDLKTMFESASPYIKSIFPLVESIIEDNKTDNDIKEFDKSVILSPDDKKLIDQFEKYEGKDTYAQELQDRVIDVYKKEQELGEERKEKIQNVVDELSKLQEKKAAEKEDDNEEEPNNPIVESIEGGLGMFSYVPETLFNSIFVNKSKMIMNESAAGADLASNSEEILAETICTYTLLECIHSLGIKTFTPKEREKLRYDFFVN